jgi:hypothetical protein
MRWIVTLVVTSLLLVVSGGATDAAQLGSGPARPTIKAAVPAGTTVAVRRGGAVPDVRTGPVVLADPPGLEAAPRTYACVGYELRMGTDRAAPLVLRSRGPPRS